MKRSAFGSIAVIAVIASLAAPVSAEPPPSTTTSRLEFTRLVAHWAGYADQAAYLSFIDDAQPDIAQIGFYGAHFWSLAHTSQFNGYPAHFPVQGLKECGDWFQNLNGELHRRGTKVVGHFNVKFLVGDPESKDGPRGFFKFYKDLWDERELGPKPVADPLALLEINADGTPITNANYSIGGMKEYWGCLNNPQWRAVLKAWTKRGIERGVDGYIINYFYRHNCLCEHCRREFRGYLRERFKPQELNNLFQIADLDKHVFTEIVSWHDPKESTPLRREMLRFSQVANKRAFDDVFVEYGRKLKPGLIVAQWDHLGNFHQISGDERCLLPAEMWGKNEDYLWYSSGASAVFTDLAEGFLGDLTLQARYLRGAFDDKPFTMGKYEHTRIRSAISELAANGGAPMGFYTNFADPAARAEIVRYYQFIKRNDGLYRANRSHGESLLIYPRTHVHRGDMAALEDFKRVGRELLDRHVLFDVLPDDIATPDARARYRQVYSPPYPPLAVSPLAREEASKFEAPQTVRISASRPAAGDEIDLHFVNYNREEPREKKSAGRGIIDEKPIAVEEIKVDFRIPAGLHVTGIEFLTPEAPEPIKLPPPPTNGTRVLFTAPRFLVYGVARIKLEKQP